MYHQHQVPYERIKLPIYYKYPINTVENTLQKLLKKRHLPSSTLYTVENTIHMKPPWQWQVYLQVSLWDAARNAHARKADEGQPLAEKPRVSNGSHKMSHIFTRPGKHTKIELENGHWNSGFTMIYPSTMVDLSISFFVCLPEGRSWKLIGHPDIPTNPSKSEKKKRLTCAP